MKAADFSVTANNFILVVDAGHTRISILKPLEYELRFVTLVLSEGILCYKLFVVHFIFSFSLCVFNCFSSFSKLISLFSLVETPRRLFNFFMSTSV